MLDCLHHSRPARRTRLGLELLDARDVPATLDLTSYGAQGTANGALFEQTSTQPTGSGVIHSFVRVQETGVEQGYNTDARPLQFDENKSPIFTRSLPIGQLPGVTVNGVSYREFLLDINQKSSSPLLSLDELRLYVGGAPNLTGYDPATKMLAGLAPIYDMDGAGDMTVMLNARLSHGSGSGDMTFLVPDSAFAGASAGGYLYLYSNFGQTWTANGGFEEWAVRSGGTFTPPPVAGPASLSGKVYLNDSNSTPLAGITINFLDATGAVVASTTTFPDGTYAFNGLVPGTYTVQQVLDPLGPYYGVASAIGTVNGTADGTFNGVSSIGQVTLNPGNNGVGYNFIDAMSNPGGM